MMQLGEAEGMPSSPTTFIGCSVIWCSWCGRHELWFFGRQHLSCLISLCDTDQTMNKLGNAGLCISYTKIVTIS